MTERDSLELLIDIRAKGGDVLASLARVTTQVETADKNATAANKELENQLKKNAETMGGSMVKAQLLAHGIMQVASAVKTYTVEAAQYAARTEQVSGVMDNLARVNGMSVNSVRMVANGIKELGITTQESRNTVNMMIGSQLDLTKSLDLTRMAQNAAKVAGINSSDALQRMVYAITSGQPEMLRTLGIAVSFENAYQRAATAAGKHANSLTEQEKLNIRLNAVLARGPLIDGSYIMSLTTAAGQMQSMQRYTDELKNSLGQGLQPALLDVVTGMERLTKFAQNNIDTFQQMTAGVTALGVAGAVFAATPFIPLPYRAAVAGAAGVGTYLAVNQDPVESNTDKYRGAFKKLDEQRSVMAKQLELGLVDEKAFKRFSDQLPAFRELLRARFIEEQSEIFKQRKAYGGGLPKGMMERWDLADKVHVTREEIESAMSGKSVPLDKSGLIAKNPLMDQPTTVDADAAKKAAKKLEDRHRDMLALLDNLADKGLDPLARLVLDTEQKLRAMARQYGGITSTEAAYAGAALEGAFFREFQKKKIEPEAVDLNTTGFQYGWQKPTAQEAELKNPNRGEEIIASTRERAVRNMQRYVSFQEQMVRLTSGPGGEAAAVNEVMQLRIYSAQREYDMSMKTVMDRGKMEDAMDQARKERLVAIAQMQQAEIERTRQAAGGIYDAMVTKGKTGLQDFAKGQFQVVGRTLFQNGAVEVATTLKDKLNLGSLIGGQVGADGKLTGTGRFLKGTPLGVDPAKLAMEMNTSETKMNTMAMRDLNTTLKTGATANAGAAASPGTSVADATAEALDKAGSTKLASRLQKYAGTAVAVGAGIYGVQQGLQQGGVKGALNTGAGVAGMASGLISSKLFGASLAAGPLAPILAGVGIAIPLLTSMFGQNKQKFDKDQTETLERNKYTEGTASNRVTDIRGADVDYDFQGRLRNGNEKQTIIQFHIQAMDSKSFLDRSADIAEAVHKELRNGNRIGLDIQQAVLQA